MPLDTFWEFMQAPEPTLFNREIVINPPKVSLSTQVPPLLNWAI